MKSTFSISMLAIAVAGLCWLGTSVRAATGGERKGTVEMITVHGKSLEGNLEGDSPDRPVYVYLPPSYTTEKSRRYPVLYFLHGYWATPDFYWKMMDMPATADKAMNSGAVHESILVFPNAHTIYDGSMYSNSPTTGDWETYVTRDLVSYIDGHYRTLATRDSRGLAGHSMGGYGTVRIGMKYPQVYSSIYAMSSCCLMNDPAAQRALARPPDSKSGSGDKAIPPNVFANVFNAEAAAWSPNPKNAPKFFDLPIEGDKVRPEIAAKWIANSPLAMVGGYVSNLKEYRAFMMDCGLQDGLVTSNKELDASLTELGVPHKFETYEGDHTNHVKDRFEQNVLPFFSENLKSKAR